MIRLTRIICLLVLLIGTSAFAQIVIDPEDDPTVIDTTETSPPVTSPPVMDFLPSPMCDPEVDEVNIAGLDCSQFPTTCLYVDVIDEFGVPISGMTADSFCVTQDGVPISSFTVQQISSDSCVTSVCFVIDLSGSMRNEGRLDSAQAAMHRFVDNMDPYDRVAIVGFASCVETIIDFTSDQIALHTAIDGLDAHGKTAMFDGVWKGVDLTKTEYGSKAVIAYSDGLENASQLCWPPPDGITSPGQNHYLNDSILICDLANAAGIPIYTFNLDMIRTTWYNPYALQAFATGTGGFWAHAPDGGSIDSVYNSIKARLCSRYYICYESLDTIQNGDWHTTTVCYNGSSGCTPCDTSMCQEAAAPIIVRTDATIALSSTCQPNTSSLDICAYVTDQDTPVLDLDVKLFYRTASGIYTSIQMALADAGTGDSTFCATIPAGTGNCMAWADYYITASDGQANVSDPSVNPQASPYRVDFCGTDPPVADAGPDQTILQCAPSQICWAAGCSDPDNNLVSCELYTGPSGATYDGTNICFTPTGTLNYEFVIKAVDECGSEDYDTAVVYYTLNSPPVADAGDDSTLFLCNAQEICWPAGCTDVDGNLTDCQLISGPGTYNGTSICFTPSATGIYSFVLEATDACGATDRDTVEIDVTLNSAPVCTVPANTSFFQCTPQEVSLPCSASDVDGNLDVCQIISGPGSLVGGSWTYTPSTDQTVNVTVRCEDDCGAFCESQFTVEFDLNENPTIALDADFTLFLCATEEVCLDYVASDPDVGQITTVTLPSGYGTLNTTAGTICFTPDTSGTYEFIAQIEDECGVTASDTIAVTINFNAPPIADAGADQSVNQCNPTEICLTAGCTDVDDNLATCELVSPVGSFDGTEICFTPSATGTYEFVLKATDACGATHYDTAEVDVTMNSAPTIIAQADTSVFYCNTEELCISYSVDDPDGMTGLVETMVAGYGTINTATDQVCFTPTTEGDYEFILQVADPCGETSRDTVTVTVTLGESPQITCPGSAFDVFQCVPDSVIQPLVITPDTATVTVDQGIYADGAIRFLPASSGSHTIHVTASVQCGTDECDVTFNVAHNAAPVANAGSDQTVFQCIPSELCWGVSCSDVDGNLSACELISSVGTYDGTNICFTPTGSGSYEFVLKATDACGATDYDTVEVDITINSAPTVTAEADFDVFQCTPAEICVSYSTDDVDGHALMETMVAGYGAMNASNNEICFTPTTSGDYEFIIGVSDPCSETDQDTVTVTVTLGEVAAITCPSGTFTEFLCGPDSIIQPITVTPDSATVTVSEGIYADGAIRFLAGTAGTYDIRVIASIECGADTCDVSFDVTHNTAPVANAGSDQSIFQCDPAEICWPASCTDIDGNLSACELVSGTGTYDGFNICFTPTGSEDYEFVLKATDACGAVGYDTVNIDVTINSAPTVVAEADFSVFQCSPEQICVTYAADDIDGLTGLMETMIAGYGTIDPANDRICFTPTSAGDYEFIIGVNDACGDSDQDTVTVSVTFGEMASITCPTGTFTEFLCGPDSIIQPITITPDTATVTVSQGIYADGAIRFLASTAGTYDIQVIAAVECGADTCDVSFDVTHNTAPVADAGSDQSVFQCVPAEICWPVSCTDIDGNLANCELTSATGSYDGTNICFTPTLSGSYDFILKATDDCGATHYDTVTIEVTLNSAPTVAAQADSSLFLCDPTEVCVSYAPADPDGLNGLTETMISGYGAIDAANDRICFTPTESGTYEFVVGVTDGCGVSEEDTVVVTVTFGEVAVIDCPATETDVFLCDPDQVCQLVGISPSTAIVSVSHGTFSNGELCFTADTAGTYVIEIIADESCGSDTCEITFNVTIGEEPQIACPAPESRFICEAGSVCVPVGVVGAGAAVSVSPIGTYSGGNLCFPADTSGHYVLRMIATTDCGVDTCDVEVDVTINSNPIAVNPTTPVDTFMCNPDQVCYQFAASDVNGGSLTWSRLSGDGTVATDGQWCFDVTASGAKTVSAKVTDECGAADTVSLTYNIDMNDSPLLTVGNDESIFLCNGQSYCFDYTLTDADDNVTLEQLVGGVGTIDAINDEVCFTPASSGTYQFIVEATDACGATDRDTIEFVVVVGEALTITGPADTSVFLCSAEEICRPISIPVDTAVTVSPIGYYNGTEICFDADTAGHYVIDVETISSCGSATAQVIVDVTLNSNPVAVNPTTPVDTFMCNPDQVCYQFTATDVDGGVQTWSRLSGDGTVATDGQWCFDVTVSGSKTVTAVVTDDCGAADTVSLTYNIDMNESPVIAFGNDQSIFLCTGSSYCIDYSVSDADNNVSLEALISGTGTIDTGNDQVCFTPATAGTYRFIVEATDACGATDRDTIDITVEIGTAVALTCPADTTVFLCAADVICRPVGLSISSADVTVSPIGTYDAGEVCFTADTAGHYVIDVTATSDCGSDDCSFVVDVIMNSNPVAVDPASPVDTFLCTPAQVCYQFEATDVDGGPLTWNRVSGDGTISTEGLWCFDANATGSWTVVAEVTDPCGATDQVTLTYNIDMNDSPIVSLGNDLSVFVCDGSPFCFDYTASDADDNLTSVDLVGGTGTIDTNTGEVCFTPTSSGTYQFIVEALDACGAIARDTINITADVGNALSLQCPNDTSMFLCGPAQICRPVDIPVDTLVTVSPIGSYSSGEVCFDADTAGHYVIDVETYSSCGSASCQIVVDIIMNAPPVAVDPDSPVDTFLCDPIDIQFQFEASDVDGGTLTWSRLSGNGTVSVDGLWNFAATATGTYEVLAVVTDDCGLADTVQLTYNVVLNSDPVIAFGKTIPAVFSCGPDDICVDYTATDPDDNIELEELLSGFGTIDPEAGSVCFFADTAGTYPLIVRVTDACGAFSVDTLMATVVFNAPPVAGAGADQSLFQCEPTEICWTAGCSDPNDNLATCEMTTGVGTFDGTQVCFTPDTAGSYTFVIRAEDECGAYHEDEVVVTVVFNSAPVCEVPADTTIFQCSPSQVSLPVTASDVDDNLDHCEITSGPGSLVGGNWLFTPSTDQTVDVVVTCFDECGATCVDTFSVMFDINAAPVVELGEDQSLFFCGDGTVLIDVDVSDEDGHAVTVEETSGYGQYDPGTGQVSFDVAHGNDRSYTVVVSATDSCGAVDIDTVVVAVEFNSAPVVETPPDFVSYLDQGGDICFDIDIIDDEGNVSSVAVSPDGEYDPNTGQVCFPAFLSGEYCLEITATDQCGAFDVDTICISAEIDECIHVQIEKVHNVLQGHLQPVNLYLNGTGKEIGAFDMLIAYDQTAITPTGVVPGSLLESCGWEYFTYRFGADGNCGDGCPNGLLRVVGVAETNNGAYHPGCYLDAMVGPLAEIEFLVTNNRTLECQYVPISFFWMDCADNTVSSKAGDTMFVARNVYDFELRTITDYEYGFPGFFGTPWSCMTGGGDGKPVPVRCVDFTNGGIDIICADSIDGRGDINLNGLAYEVADAVMLTNYFIHGLGSFGSGMQVEGSIAASDVNADGITLSVADLVYLIRVIVGDTPDMPKLVPGTTFESEFEIVGHTLQVSKATSHIGAINMIIEGEAVPTLHANAGKMELQHHFDGTETRILIYNRNGSAFLDEGPILTLEGSNRVKEVGAGSYEGYMMATAINSLPDSYSLSQNYPNPFNPVTTIEFTMPVDGEWNMTIYNILGQVVEDFGEEAEAGYHKVEWDASRYASGIYFYRLTVGGYSATRKMVLLK